MSTHTWEIVSLYGKTIHLKMRLPCGHDYRAKMKRDGEFPPEPRRCGECDFWLAHWTPEERACR